MAAKLNRSISTSGEEISSQASTAAADELHEQHHQPPQASMMAAKNGDDSMESIPSYLLPLPLSPQLLARAEKEVNEREEWRERDIQALREILSGNINCSLECCYSWANPFPFLWFR